MAIRLSFETGQLAGIHVVTAAKALRLGRDPQQNDLVLENPLVSRTHAQIGVVNTDYVIQFLGAQSTLNGEPIPQNSVHRLSSGDRVALGGVHLIFSEVAARLVIVGGRNAGRELVMDGNETIGGGDCDLVLPGADRRHATLSPMALGYRLDAIEAVVINGRPVKSHMLVDGDELVIANTTLRFVVTATGIGIDSEAPITIPPAPNTLGELVFLAGAAKGHRLPLGDEQIILGVRGDCTFPLNDPVASPIHCAISKNGPDLVVTDLGSRSGTMINGARITSGMQLTPGDLVTVGQHVFEARLVGGIAQAKKGSTTFVPGAQQKPQPRFVVDGRVVKAAKMSIGRAPSNELIIDDPTVSREHCRLEWHDRFVVVSISTQGTYLDDKRVAHQALPPTATLRMGNAVLRLAAHGEVCTVERVDADLAQAAVDVARKHASLIKHRPGPGEAMKTIFRMDAPAVEHEVAARKRDIKRGAPAWRPSSDLARDGATRGAVLLSIVATLVLCAVAFTRGRGEALVNHPLSQGHSSVQFTSKIDGTNVCSTCHTAGARTDNGRCASCHTGFASRAAHKETACGECHREHDGAPRGTALNASAQCAECHPNQHAKDFAATGPQTLTAGPLPPGRFVVATHETASNNGTNNAAGTTTTGTTTTGTTGTAPVSLTVAAARMSLLDLHVAHSSVTIAGKAVGISCTSCHAGTAPPQPNTAPAPVEGNAGLACFRCHQGKERASTTGCQSCHASEHTATLTRLPADSPQLVGAITVPHPGTSIVFALGLVGLGSIPPLLLAAWLRVRRRRNQLKLVQKLAAHPAEIIKRLVHSINDSKCVGCGLCVQACPASVLELVEHKSRVVNFDACIQCKKCEVSCAFDALRMHDADKPPPMVPMPSVDAFHETPVPGLYLIGQASGVPQVKNATNLGRAVIQRMVQRGLQAGTARAMGMDVDVVIVGSGPAGLSAALTCVELGLTYAVLEKERALAWTIRNYYHKGKEVMAEPHDVGLEATLPHWDTSREELLGAWEGLVNQHQIAIHYQHDVIDVKAMGDRFAVVIGDNGGKPRGQFTCARVVVAIGTLGNPRKLGCPGDDLEKVKNSLVDPDEWNGKSILVLGGSDSAVEVVLALCKPAKNNRVTFSTRGAKLEGIKPRNRKLLEDALNAGQFVMKHATQAAEVTPQSAALTHRDDQRREDFPNDVVFAMIGGNSPQKWLQGIGIPYVDKPHSWSPPRTDLLSQRTAEGLVQIRRLVKR